MSDGTLKIKTVQSGEPLVLQTDSLFISHNVLLIIVFKVTKSFCLIIFMCSLELEIWLCHACRINRKGNSIQAKTLRIFVDNS